MPKRKAEEPQGDKASTKKAKVAPDTSAVVTKPDTNKGRSGPKTRDAPSQLASSSKDSGSQPRRDTKGEGKAADNVVEGEDQEMDEEEESSEERVTTTPSHKIRKLAPPRPYPTVPTSASATGPRSARSEGKNYICITRKTSLGAYLRRCKDVIMKDGYKTLHLNAMGAAIPHLLQLTVSLPSTLPHPAEEIHTEVLTDTVEVTDEVVPEDEDEDISYKTRGKSTLSVIIKIGDGVDEVLRQPKNKAKGKNARRGGGIPRDRPSGKHKGNEGKSSAMKDTSGPERVVIRAEDMDEG